MTLHQAIETLIKKHNRPMSAIEIALELNKTRLYTKKDGKDITSNQIEARVNNYTKLFSTEGSLIGLNSGTLKAGDPNNKLGVMLASPNETRHTLKVANPALGMKVLLNVKNFKPAASVDKIVPDQPGLYAIRIQRPNALPKTYAQILEERKHNLLYIGVAEQSLKTKLLGDELRGQGHGSFFNRLGAILGYLPAKGSLTKDGNFSFSEQDERSIVIWINKYLRINWLCMDDGWDHLETQLIIDEHPLLNIDKNPMALKELKAALKKCANHAKTA